VSQESDAFAAAGVALVDAVAAAINDPADGIRLLIPLAQWSPPVVPGSGPLAQRTTLALAAIADNLRCAACAALAEATGRYLPGSYQDAQALRTTVCGVLDAEATRAADAGLDATYAALRDLRTMVSMDLALRGANLATLVEVTTAVAMPSLAETWTLYQDTTREPAIVASSGVRAPLWMPLDFQALSR
jgi:prophage DNA circulation protein